MQRTPLQMQAANLLHLAQNAFHPLIADFQLSQAARMMVKDYFKQRSKRESRKLAIAVESRLS